MVTGKQFLIQQADAQAELDGLVYSTLFKAQYLRQHERHVIVPHHVIPVLINITKQDGVHGKSLAPAITAHQLPNLDVTVEADIKRKIVKPCLLWPCHNYITIYISPLQDISISLLLIIILRILF